MGQAKLADLSKLRMCPRHLPDGSVVGLPAGRARPVARVVLVPDLLK